MKYVISHFTTNSPSRGGRSLKTICGKTLSYESNTAAGTAHVQSAIAWYTLHDEEHVVEVKCTECLNLLILWDVK